MGKAKANIMEVILMIGIPGSGKTTFAKIAFPNHVHISLDRIREFSHQQKQEMLRKYRTDLPRKLSKERKIEHVMITDALKRDRNIVVDDTNLTIAIRRHHICTASQHHAIISAVFFQNIQST